MMRRDAFITSCQPRKPSGIVTSDRREKAIAMITRMTEALYFTIVASLSIVLCSAFVTNHHGAIHSAAKPSISSRDAALHVLAPYTFFDSTLNTAVEIFDGSGVDPVVVSNVFWSRLQGNFISVLIGNFLAAIVFAFIMSQASAQLSKLGSFVTENVFKSKIGVAGNRASATFQRA